MFYSAQSASWIPFYQNLFQIIHLHLIDKANHAYKQKALPLPNLPVVAIATCPMIKIVPSKCLAHRKFTAVLAISKAPS